MTELILNGILEEEVSKYYHICFYTDRKGPEPDKDEHYIFVPKAVCRIVDHYTVSVLEWYVKKKHLTLYIRRGRPKRPLNQQEQSRASTVLEQWKAHKPMGSVRRK